MANRRRELSYRDATELIEDGDPRFVRTLARGLALLRCFRPGERWLGNNELAERSGLSRTAVSRFTYTLGRLGYLSYAPKRNKYALGTALLVTTFPMLANLAVRRIARPYMQELANQVRGVVSLGVRHGMGMLYVESCACSTARIPVVVGIGSRVPLARTAMGRAHLAGLSEIERAMLLREMAAHYPEQWAELAERIRLALVQYGKVGYCVSEPGLAKESRAVGVALRHAPDGVAYAFNCGVPAFRLDPGQLESDIGPRLRSMVACVEMALVEAGSVASAGATQAPNEEA
ncbi:IclR family transcriptional regulator [Verticiella sediminum]|uniref:IclR family transcriptional regulator n=1 Tax=Verticiella sediminum TaxID=1247510 RepID=A0A556AYU2_9BURK|nr:IclR family transcriptional regulator [Verticiella sediminum]TSH98107.1 IclR family transcriptional regulator [Verticiella sediminum]